MTKRIDVLDAGYIEVVDIWGSDEKIIEAARMSTDKGFQGWGRRCVSCGFLESAQDHEAGCEEASRTEGVRYREGDEKLLRYLWEHKHATPFEMAGMIVEVKAPIFVFREWHRHRTQSYNEMSARYIPLPDENYTPTVERLLINSNTNKQAGVVKGALGLTEVAAETFQTLLKQSYMDAEGLYQNALQAGVPKELARLCLPVGRYSKMRASANLRNWLAFLTLRMDSAAQWEIRQFANAVGQMISESFPKTWELFVKKPE